MHGVLEDCESYLQDVPWGVAVNVIERIREPSPAAWRSAQDPRLSRRSRT